MTELLSAESIIVNLSSQIELQWIAGEEDPLRPLHQIDAADHATLIGHLNLIHENIIQVIGKTECDYLQNLNEDFRTSILNQIFGGKTVAIIMSEGIPVPARLIECANAGHVPLLSCKADSNNVIDMARYYLHDLFTSKETIHGVFMEVLGTGVLLTGDSSVGKSELALELITRGHRLIADDAPVFTRTAPNVLNGKSPRMLRDFMEVRGLGVLNIREMYGDNALKRNKYLRLIIHMKEMNTDELSALDRLNGTRNIRTISGVEIPEMLLPVAPGRNLAVLVEAAVSNHVLREKGQDATEQLIRLQQQAIEDKNMLP